MSRTLLNRLNGDNRGLFRDWLDRTPWEPRIAWYPSCGGDFKDLLYLHRSVLRQSPGMPQPPDILIHTDCSTGLREPFNRVRIDQTLQPMHEDPWTRVSILFSEELPQLDVSEAACDEDLSQFKASSDYGRVFFLLMQIQSDRLGTLLQPVIYAFAENGAFASQVLLETQARITHLWNVCPGSSPNPWLAYLLRRLKTECVIRSSVDGFYTEEYLDYKREAYFKLFPNLEGAPEDYPDFASWREIKATPQLQFFIGEPTRLKRERRVVDYLLATQPTCQWLDARLRINILSHSKSLFAIRLSERRSDMGTHSVLAGLIQDPEAIGRSAVKAFMNHTLKPDGLDMALLEYDMDCYVKWEHDPGDTTLRFSHGYGTPTIFRMGFLEKPFSSTPPSGSRSRATPTSPSNTPSGRPWSSSMPSRMPSSPRPDPNSLPSRHPTQPRRSRHSQPPRRQAHHP